MDWGLSDTSGFIAGLLSVGVGLIIIIWPRVVAIIIGLYLIAIGGLAIASSIV